ncbi:hypothetical protein PHAVU_011G163850 [Phaseolus vulgaris]
MIDVVFVMTNSRLMKKKDVRKIENYNIDDLSSDDEWNVMENETLDDDILPEVGEDDASRGVVAPSINDLEVPPIDDNENEDHLKEEDDYPMINVNNFLG